MGRIYIGRLSNDARESDVERLAKKYGRLKSGFGFVEFDDRRDAEDAVHALDGVDFFGQRIQVEMARGGRDRVSSSAIGGYRGSSSSSGAPKFGKALRTDYRVIVENLSSRTSWQDLKDFMREVADVGYADVNNPREGEGVVEFATRADMEDAIRKLDGRECDGRRVRLFEDKPRRRSRSRSPRRSRSPARRSRSPARRSRSPARRSRSPARRSRSRSPARRSASPAPHKASRSPSPVKRSRSSRSPSVEKKANSRSPSPRD